MNAAISAPQETYLPPQPTDPGYAEWYALQECLDATYREIPSDRYDYFEEIRHD
jgi:hypothetical protein